MQLSLNQNANMKTRTNILGEEEVIFLSQDDLDMLIYMESDVWITPEIKKFKNEILEGLNNNDFKE